MTAPCKSEQRDKLAIVLLCGITLAIIGGIAGGAITNRIPSDSQTLLGVIVGGLLLFIRECLQAVRAFAQDMKTGKLTDQLAASTTISPVESPPPSIIDAAQDVADASQAKADKIAGATT